MMKAGQGDVAAWSIDRRQRGTSMTGMHCSSIAGSTGQSWASTFSRSRDAGTAILLNANWLPRDARSVISLNAKSPEIVEAQLPLLMTMKPSFEEVAGSLPPCSHVSVGPYDTSCSWAMESHESLTGLLHLYQVAILTPPTTLPPRGSLTNLAGLPGSRIHQDPDPGARHKSDPTPNPLPREGDLSRAHPSKVTILTGGHH